VARLPPGHILRLLGRSVGGLIYELVGGFAGWVEEFLTVLLGSVLSVIGVMVVVMTTAETKHPGQAWIVVLLWIALDGPYLVRLWHGNARQGKDHWPLSLAVGQPMWPLLLRPRRVLQVDGTFRASCFLRLRIS